MCLIARHFIFSKRSKRYLDKSKSASYYFSKSCFIRLRFFIESDMISDIFWLITVNYRFILSRCICQSSISKLLSKQLEIISIIPKWEPSGKSQYFMLWWRGSTKPTAPSFRKKIELISSPSWYTYSFY